MSTFPCHRCGHVVQPYGTCPNCTRMMNNTAYKYESKPMKGKVAIVTGGMGDIGEAICISLYDLGATVIAVDIDARNQSVQWMQESADFGYPINFIQADVSSFDSCLNIKEALKVGKINVDILVNAAGIIQDSSFVKMDLDKWNKVLDVNLSSMFNVTKQVIDGMIERGYGRIINISSVNGLKGQFGQTNYSASKAGIYGFTKSLALEVASKGITVNSVSPGFVESKMVQSIPDDVQKKIIESIPVKRLAKPEEIAQVVTFLASEKSGYITGTDISVNGGYFTG